MTKRSVALVGVLILMVMVGSLVIGSFAGRAADSLYVFPSTTTTNGDAGWRSGTALICEATDVDSHPCSVEEIEKAWIETGVKFETFSIPAAWVDTAILGTLASNYDTSTPSDWSGGSAGSPPWNCEGWTSASSSAYGSIIVQSGRDRVNDSCDTVWPVACCKRLP